MPSVGFSAGASAGFSAPGGVSEIWATALAVSISTLARIDIEWRNFIPGAIPVRPYLVLCFVLMPRRSLAGSPVRHLPVLALPRAIAWARRRRAFEQFWKQYRQSPMGIWGLVLMGFFVFIAVAAPLLADRQGLDVAHSLATSKQFGERRATDDIS